MHDVNITEVREQHGGNLSWLMAHYPQAARPLIDLSTGINPYAYPLPDVTAEWHHRLPDPADIIAASRAAARYYGAGADALTLASGMQPLMFALAALRMKEHGASDVAILSPTYEEHRRVWHAAGHRVIPIATLDHTPAGGVVIACNPNNPDGRLASPAQLHKLARHLDKQGGWLLVDESFADLRPEFSVAAEIGPNVAVLRSCGKFFGAAGLRASAAIAPPAWTRWLRTASGPWPLSTTACHLLPVMLSDEVWIAAMRLQLAQEASHWRSLLSEYFSLVGHTALFTLVETPQAAAWHAHLAAQGILTRRFRYHPHWLRFGLPHHLHLKRLQAALASGPQP